MLIFVENLTSVGSEFQLVVLWQTQITSSILPRD
jgi:hypothetical protein